MLSEHKALCPALVSAVKTDPSVPGIYDLRVRTRANRASQKANLEDLCSLFCLVDSLRIAVALAAAFRLILSLLDAVNAR